MFYAKPVAALLQLFLGWVGRVFLIFHIQSDPTTSSCWNLWRRRPKVQLSALDDNWVVGRVFDFNYFKYFCRFQKHKITKLEDKQAKIIFMDNDKLSSIIKETEANLMRLKVCVLFYLVESFEDEKSFLKKLKLFLNE